MGLMERSPFQLRIASLLGVVACIALNLWLFRVGVFWGIVGLNVSKHVVIAYLCQILGVDRRGRNASPPVPVPLGVPVPVPVRSAPSPAVVP
jgi:hypothetical protein